MWISALIDRLGGPVVSVESSFQDPRRTREGDVPERRRGGRRGIPVSEPSQAGGAWPRRVIAWLLETPVVVPGRLVPRWLFLRALGGIYLSAFYSLKVQIVGLIGPNGILPATDYLRVVAGTLGPWRRVWYAPTLLWFSSGPAMLSALCWAGMLVSLLLLFNLWPRAMLMACLVCFLSFVSAAQDFSGYQSDGMLLEAGFVSLFLAPPGLRPGLGRAHEPSRLSLALLRWEWFRIYFESGLVKLLSGDLQWRHFTAMDEYYQNGPLPTWIGYYVQHLPHWFHAATVGATLLLELGLVNMLFLPRRFRLACFWIATPWQVGVILTANYAFLNYLVLAMGLLLVDDRLMMSCLPAGQRQRLAIAVERQVAKPVTARRLGVVRSWRVAGLASSGLVLLWVAYATGSQLIWLIARVPLPTAPVRALEPLRIANQYGLFAVMTRGRYEIEFQGSADGERWVAYPFRYKPQALAEAPGIYAPYQPRFEWNLWFASLGSWREYPIVPNTAFRLLAGDKEVVRLFGVDPFAREPPRVVRVVLWQYWFTTMAEKRATGLWWRRRLLGLYSPTLERTSDGRVKVVEWPTVGPRE
jgi:lipase maturation factor 1